MKDKVPVVTFVEREIASSFQKRYPRCASEMIRSCILHSLKHSSFLHDLLYCEYDDDSHSFVDYIGAKND